MERNGGPHLSLTRATFTEQRGHSVTAVASQRFGAVSLLAALTVSVGCADGLRTPSAYDEQRYLCADDAALLEARTLECADQRAAGKPCFGAISFRGRLEMSPLTVESLIPTTEYQVDSASGTVQETSATSASPYFRYTFKLKSLGLSLTTPPAGEAAFVFDPSATSRPDSLNDNQVEGSMRIFVGVDATEFVANAGTVTVRLKPGGEMSGRFEGPFGNSPGDTLEGCFHWFR